MKRREHEKAQQKENDDKPGADLVANNARHLRKFIIIHHLTPPSVHGHARRDRRASSSTARVAPMAGDKRSRCWFLTAGHEMPLIEKPHLLPLIFLTRTNRWSRQRPSCQISVSLNVVFPTFSKKIHRGKNRRYRGKVQENGRLPPNPARRTYSPRTSSTMRASPC